MATQFPENNIEHNKCVRKDPGQKRYLLTFDKMTDNVSIENDLTLGFAHHSERYSSIRENVPPKFCLIRIANGLWNHSRQ